MSSTQNETKSSKFITFLKRAALLIGVVASVATVATFYFDVQKERTVATRVAKENETQVARFAEENTRSAVDADANSTVIAVLEGIQDINTTIAARNGGFDQNEVTKLEATATALGIELENAQATLQVTPEALAQIDLNTSTPTQTPSSTNTPTPIGTPTSTPTPEPTSTPTSTSTPEPWPITVVLDHTQESANWPNITRTIVKVEIYEDKSIWFVEYRNESPERRFLGFNWDTYIIDSNGDLFTLATALPENARIESERRLEYQFEFDSPTLVPGEFVFVVRGEMGGFAKSSVHFEEARIDIAYSIPSD